MTRFAWVLNLAADDELASLRRAGAASGHAQRRVPKAAVRARMAERVAELALLVASGVLIGVGRDAEARGLRGRAFCPTPSALEELAASGAFVPLAPTPHILARANHRLFCAELGQTLDAALWIEDEASLEAAFESRVLPSGSEWVLKHPHGYVGRLRHKTHAFDLRTKSFAFRCFSEAGGLQLEPWVERRGDYAIHGYVASGGHVTLGSATLQVCDANGVWQKTARAHDLSTNEVRVLFDEGQRVAESLREIGYFGPFGVDGFRYTDGARIRFNPRCEVNARYTMGWAIGMGGVRPDLSDD